MRMKQRWDRHAIKAEIHRRGGTLIGIAHDAGIEPSSTRVALHRRNPAGEQAIAAFLGTDPADLWPERYTARITRVMTHTPEPFRPASLKRSAA